MSFSTDLANLVADQLSRLATLNRHQLAGQVANLDFWLAQVHHALATIDGYGERFVRLQMMQEQYVTTHGTTVSVFNAPGNYATEHKPAPPRRVPDRELQKARRALIDAASLFLERCKRENVISSPQFVESRRMLGIVE